MKSEADLLIVSALGRGNWLAAEMAEQGLEVCLLDVSSQMGRWSPEDWEGPFGFFHSEELTDSQLARLNEEDYHDPVDQGFTVWLKKGPIDLKGPHSGYLIEHEGIDPDVETYLSEYSHLPESERQKFRRSVAAKDFKNTWLAHLAHQMASTTFSDNAQSAFEGDPLSVFSPLSVRRVSRRGYEKNLDWVGQRGAQVFTDVKLKDLQIEGRQIKSIEMESAKSGVLSAKKYVWMLSSEETLRFPEIFSKTFFPAGAAKPQWTWVRYRLQLNEGPYAHALPVTFVVIEDLCLPWTHTNMCVVQRTVSPHDFDCWVRIPNHQRFQRNYLEKISQEVVDIFLRRIPDSGAQCLEMPQDYHYDYDELGPSLYPVYAPGTLKKVSRAQLKNLSFDGPETWQRLDWTGQMKHQRKISDELRSWKASLEQ